MNIGGVAHISERAITLPIGLLQALSIREGGTLVAMYYPVPTDEPQYEYVERRPDLMLTPVPPRMWPTVGRLGIRLKHRPGALHKVASTLAERRIEVLSAECNRSAHRYATWTLIASVEKLVDKRRELTFDEVGNVYNETREAISKIQTSLRKECKKWLFQDQRNLDLQETIVFEPIQALAYFYHRLCVTRKEAGDQWEDSPHRPFDLELRNGALISKNQDLANVLGHIGDEWKIEMPACGFVEMDTRDANGRLVIIPSQRLHRFSRGRVEYRRFGKLKTSRGLLAGISKAFSTEYNIWRTFNQTAINRSSMEIGAAVILFEDVAKRDLSARQARDRAKRLFEGLKMNDFEGGSRNLQVTDATVSPLHPDTLYEELRSDLRIEGIPKNDVFISYSAKDQEQAEMIEAALHGAGLNPYLAAKDLDDNAGVNFAERIRQALLDSTEVAILCSKEALISEWVTTEWGAAWALDKHIVPILYQVNKSDLPERLQLLQYIDLHKIDAYAEQVRRRVDESIRRTPAPGTWQSW